MKLKASKRDIKNNSNKVLKIGYCAIQTLLHYQQPFAYSCSQNGWACDYYDVDGITISTGCSPIGDHVNIKLIVEYEDKAKKIVFNNYNEAYESKVNKVSKLLLEFIQKAAQ